MYTARPGQQAAEYLDPRGLLIYRPDVAGRNVVLQGTVQAIEPAAPGSMLTLAAQVLGDRLTVPVPVHFLAREPRLLAGGCYRVYGVVSATPVPAIAETTPAAIVEGYAWEPAPNPPGRDECSPLLRWPRDCTLASAAVRNWPAGRVTPTQRPFSIAERLLAALPLRGVPIQTLALTPGALDEATRVGRQALDQGWSTHPLLPQCRVTLEYALGGVPLRLSWAWDGPTGQVAPLDELARRVQAGEPLEDP